MPKHIFIAGHGRMVTGTADLKTVPEGVNIHWAVEESYNGTSSLSRAILSNTLNTWLGGTSASGSKYKEHWLCPDGPEIMAGKGATFAASSFAPDSDYFLIQPSGSFAVTLSSIIRYVRALMGGTSGSYELYWTCCRSPINQKSLGKVKYENNITTKVPYDLALKDKIGDPVGLIADGGFRNRIQMLNGDKVATSGIMGAITRKNKADPGLDKNFSWPGLPLETRA